MPAHVFISYRRDDAAGDAGRLADHLYRRFGADRVFLDIDTIHPGTDFAKVLRSSLGQTAVVLVVIGPRWTLLTAADGTRRLDDPGDFVRLEVESALERDILVVPVLVQGARLPRKEDLPASLASLVNRQVAVLDHAEFHADAERLCDRLSTVVGRRASTRWPLGRRLWLGAAALAIVVALGVVGYRALRTPDVTPIPESTAVREPEASPTMVEPPLVEADPTAAPTAPPVNETTVNRQGIAPGSPAGEATAAIPETTAPEAPDQSDRVEALLAEASMQRRRNQWVEALTTLGRARDLAPASEVVRQTQEEIAMEWIRNARVESGKSSFGEAIQPALAVVDASFPSATGARRADLLAHSGWASFLMWRDGNRQLNPEEWYREALAVDPENPYANAMLAHWIASFGERDIPRAASLFDVALRTGRALEAVRILQWAAYANASNDEADIERVRLADAMRRNGEKLSPEQSRSLWNAYYPATRANEVKRRALLEAVPPDDHISTLSWAFDEPSGTDESRSRTVQYYVALLHARAGRAEQALNDLKALRRELANEPGSLREAVEAALKQL